MSVIKELNVSEFTRSENDTGSSAVQIAIFSHRIKTITEHLKTSKKDFSATRGLLSLVNKRKNLLKYLHRTDKNKFNEVVEKLNLKVKVKV